MAAPPHCLSVTPPPTASSHPQVALIYSVNEPAAFATAFYACIFACVIPIAIDPPITKEVGEVWRGLHVYTKILHFPY